MRSTLLLLAACGTADPTDDIDDTDPAFDPVATAAAPGDFRVGYRVLDASYDDPAADGTRAVPVSVWYPTATTDASIVSFPGPHAAEGVQDAPPLADGTFPVAVFSHGHQGQPDNASHLMAHLASHGWLAIAVRHTGNDSLLDGTRTTAIYLQRPRDVSAALDAIEADPTFGPAAGPEVVAFGHSFGGYTTFLVAGASWAVDHWAPICEGGDTSSVCTGWSEALATKLGEDLSDDRVRAAVTLSGGNWGEIREAGFATVDVPLLQMSGVLDGSVTNEGSSDPIWRDLPAGGRWRADLAHGDHQSYTDFAGGAGIPGTSPDALPTDRAQRLTRAFVTAFAAWQGLGDDAYAPIFEDPAVVVDEDVTLSSK